MMLKTTMQAVESKPRTLSERGWKVLAPSASSAKMAWVTRESTAIHHGGLQCEVAELPHTPGLSLHLRMAPFALCTPFAKVLFSKCILVLPTRASCSDTEQRGGFQYLTNILFKDETVTSSRKTYFPQG